MQYSRAVWDNTGRAARFLGSGQEGVERLYLQDVAGGAPRAITGEGVSLRKICRPVSPTADGLRPWVQTGWVPALAGGEPVALPGVGELDVPICWTADGRELFVARYEVTPPRIERVDVASGRSRPWTGLGRSERMTASRLGVQAESNGQAVVELAPVSSTS